MAEIKAFKAIRFQKSAGDIRELVCPPYDIISEEQRQEYLRINPNNVIRLELPRDGENPYEAAGKTLADWLDSGILARDPEERLYIYEEEFAAHGKRMKIRGIVCLVKLEEFDKGVILPHEETLSKAKTDRFRLMQATGCNFSQIYSLYTDPEQNTPQKLAALTAEAPDIEFSGEDHITHRLWMIRDGSAVQSICEDFADRKLYIADGHHRYETALNYRNFLREIGQAPDASDYVMMMLVDMENPGLAVFPTHRLVKNLENFNKDQILSACADCFEVKSMEDYRTMEDELSLCYAAGEKAFGFYCGGEEYTLLILKDHERMKDMLPGKSRALQELDVSILHKLILERLMGIDADNLADQTHLTYVKRFDDAVQGVREGNYQCAFILNPTRVTEIRDVAAVGEKMPQKSTYFYPKLITGLVMNQLLWRKRYASV